MSHSFFIRVSTCSWHFSLFSLPHSLRLMFVRFLLEDSPKKNPFPCPTTYRTALLHYVDIASTLKTHVLRELAEYAKDFEHKEFLMNITDITEEAKVGFYSCC